MTTFQSRLVTFTSALGYPIGQGKHFNLALYNDKLYFHGGDLTESSSQEMFTYDWSTDTWTQIQNNCGCAYAGWNGTLTDMTGLRPSQPDDGAWFWDATEARFWWLPGGGQLAYGGIIFDKNHCSDGLPKNPAEGMSQEYIQTATRWRGYAMMQFEPVSKRWYDTTFTVNLNGFGQAGNIYGADNVSRGNAFDPTARKIFRVYQNGSQAIAAFDLAARTVTLYTMARLADGTYFNDPVNLTLSYAQSSLVIDPSNGYLYAVLPHTGQLLQMRTRAAPIEHDGGPVQRLPMYLLNNPISPSPSWRSTTMMGAYHYVNSDHCILRLWKGGLLYFMQEAGHVNGAWWRSLTDVENSKWIPLPMPSNFVALSWTTNVDSSGSFYAVGSHGSEPEYPTTPIRIWKVSP